MSIRLRVLIGFAVLLVPVVVLLVRWTVTDLRLQPKQAMEESLVDLSRILASMLERSVTEDGTLDTAMVRDVMARARARRFRATIYDFVKDRVNVHVYVTDASGFVIYDSNNGHAVGEDFSQRNDVYLSLRGQYGVLSSRQVPGDPATSLMVVNAPIRKDGRIVGTVAVVKPSASLAGLVQQNVRRLLGAAALILLAALGLSMVVGHWIRAPIHRLSNYVRKLRAGERVPPPETGSPEVRELTAAFEDLREQLEGRRYVEEYVQSLTHELKGPLSAIQGAVEILRENPPESDRKRFLLHVAAESDRIRRVVDRLLQLAAVEQQKWLTVREPVSLKDLALQAADSLSAQCRSRQVTIKVAGVSDTISGDAFLLEQAIRNLLDNAVRFSPAGSQVTVTLSRHENAVHLAVRDTGPGIPDYARDRIWDRFYSLPAEQGARRGTGLGLPFVREVVRLHGGRITLETSSTGTGISVLFPV